MIRVTVFVAMIAIGVVLAMNRVTRADAPPSVSAQCNDGTISASKSRTGTCSRHGGVRQWLK